MLNKIKDKIKLFLKFLEIKQIRFKNYADYREYFVNEDKNSTWDPSAFSKIIENNLEIKNNLHLVMELQGGQLQNIQLITLMKKYFVIRCRSLSTKLRSF